MLKNRTNDILALIVGHKTKRVMVSGMCFVVATFLYCP